MNPGGGAGWDDSPLDIQVPDDARELERDVIAYHRELRAKRRRNRLRRLAAPLRGNGSGTIMPLLASILAVCLVAGAMLSVATLSPAGGSRHEVTPTHQPTATSPATGSSTPASSTTGPAPSRSSSARASGTPGSSPTPRGTRQTATAQP